MGKSTKKPLSHQDTYVFIDASNIRSACLKTLGVKIDFFRLYDYFEHKYPNLKEVRYYEGIARDDVKKRATFASLEKKGYIVCGLERKSYISSDIYDLKLTCPKCKYSWDRKFARRNKTLKSNVDVYLATDLLSRAYEADKALHIVLVSCDGDYAEMIESAILKNAKLSISVLATPPAHDFKRNSLSVRLRQLCRKLPRYQLTNIADILLHIR